MSPSRSTPRAMSTQITMKPVSPIADFSFDYQDLNFTPVAAATK